MRRKLFTILAVLTVMSLMALPVFAFNVRLTSVDFSLSTQQRSGSLSVTGGADVDQLIVRGRLDGLNEHRDVVVKVEQRGTAVMNCMGGGGEMLSGSYSMPVEAVSFLYLPYIDYGKNFKHAFRNQSEQIASSTFMAACPGGSLDASGVFVFWEQAVLLVKAADTQEILFQQNYACTTVTDGVMCSPTY